MNTQNLHPADLSTTMDRVMRLPEVIRATGLGRSSLYAKIKEGSFPHSVRIGNRAVGWKASSITGWINALNVGT